MHDHPPGGGAALTGGAEAGEQRPLGGEVEVGVGHDDERVLAAELEARVLQVPAAQLADAGADVILMSFSNPGYSASLQAAIDGGAPIRLPAIIR